MSKVDYLRTRWEVQREMYLSQGEDLRALVDEADALLADDEKPVHAPSTFKTEWEAVQVRLKAQSDITMTKMGGIPAGPLMAWVDFAKGAADDRRAKIGKVLQGPRGMHYTGFLLATMGFTKDWKLASVKSMRPDISNLYGNEVADGLGAKLVEQRVRQLAAAINRVVENYYKPLLQIVWTLSAKVVNPGAGMPRMAGQLVAGCINLWKNIPEIDAGVPAFDPIPEFLDGDAVDVRNAIAHPTNIRFDPATSELVEDHDDGTETRWTEKELRRILHGQLVRCTTMDYALQFASSELPADIIVSPAAKAAAAAQGANAPAAAPTAAAGTATATAVAAAAEPTPTPDTST